MTTIKTLIENIDKSVNRVGYQKLSSTLDRSGDSIVESAGNPYLGEVTSALFDLAEKPEHYEALDRIGELYDELNERVNEMVSWKGTLPKPFDVQFDKRPFVKIDTDYVPKDNSMN